MGKVKQDEVDKTIVERKKVSYSINAQMLIKYMHPHKNPDFLHHQNMPKIATIREGIFGLEDGLVSTLGSITGIAAATHDPFTILLAGGVIISVESISMAVGSFLSSKSERQIAERKLEEERIELRRYPKYEKKELVEMYITDGWPKKLATEMSEVASKNKELFLQEMAYRELKVFPSDLESPKNNALVMGLTYIVGGFIPLSPYILLSVSQAMTVSIVITFIALFIVGVLTTKYSRRLWWKAGLEMLTLAGLAALIGYLVGQWLLYLIF